MYCNIYYKDDSRRTEDMSIISKWTLNEPVIVKSVTGSIDDERTNLEIKLSNGDLIQLDTYHEIAPYNAKEYSFLRIKPSTSNVFIKHNVEDKFLDYLCEYDNVLYTALQLYKELI